MKANRPLFELLSVVAPILIIAAWFVLDRNPGIGQSFNGYAGLFMSLGLLLGTAVAGLAGLALSVSALLRREAYSVLPILAAILNVGFFFGCEALTEANHAEWPIKPAAAPSAGRGR